MDEIDKGILLELADNCRISYQDLATQLGITVNAIKKRFDKLVESGVICGFTIYPSLAMLEADNLVARIYPEIQPQSDELLDLIGSNRMVRTGSYLADGSVLCFADYQGSMGLAELGKFLRGISSVKQVDLHTVICEKGSRCELTADDLRVLRELKTDARMPLSEIARNTGLTPRRVRKNLLKLFGESGSGWEIAVDEQSFGDQRTRQACMYSRVLWNLNAGGATFFIIRIFWKEDTASPHEVVAWLRKHFPLEFWYAYVSATAPEIYTVFMVEHLRDSKPIARKVGHQPFTESIEPIFGYPSKRFKNIRDYFLEEKFATLDK
ncbi:MAG: winged helix-turn-helix transcriptional regulator [Promethearchaeota archaeon]